MCNLYFFNFWPNCSFMQVSASTDANAYGGWSIKYNLHGIHSALSDAGLDLTYMQEHTSDSLCSQHRCKFTLFVLHLLRIREQLESVRLNINSTWFTFDAGIMFCRLCWSHYSIPPALLNISRHIEYSKPFHKATFCSMISTSCFGSQLMIKSCPACRRLTYITKCSSGVNTSSAHRKATGLNYSKPRLIPHCLTNPLGQTNFVIADVFKCSSSCSVQVS